MNYTSILSDVPIQSYKSDRTKAPFVPFVRDLTRLFVSIGQENDEENGEILGSRCFVFMILLKTHGVTAIPECQRITYRAPVGAWARSRRWRSSSREK